MGKPKRKYKQLPVRCEPCDGCPFQNGKDHEAQEAGQCDMLCHESSSLDDRHSDGVDFLCAGWHG